MTWRKPVDAANGAVSDGGDADMASGMEEDEGDGEGEQEAEEEDVDVREESAPTQELDHLPEIHEPVLESQEEREAYYQRLVKEREVERKRAIAEGKMDDPLVPKRLEDAISVVGTCMDMCPRFERWRRERESGVDRLELVRTHRFLAVVSRISCA